MEKSRIAALVDGIFAVVMTLLVLDLKFPEEVKASTDAEVGRRLMELSSHFLIYALSFVVLGTYWIGHHFQFHFIRHVDRGLLWLNLVFLFFITMIPFSTNLLAGRTSLSLPVAFYGGNILVLSLFFLSHLRYLTCHPELCHDGLTPSRIASVRWRSLVGALVSAASIGISFYQPRLALNLYLLLFAFQLIMARGDRLVM